MVILGGLEIVAAGYLLNEFNKDRVEERTRRRHKHDHDSDDDRIHSRPPHNNYDSNTLRPPIQSPPRPLSAPPKPDQRPNQWQQAASYGQQQFPQQPATTRPGQQWQPGPPQQLHFNNTNQSPPPNQGVSQTQNTFYPPQQGLQPNFNTYNQQPPPPGPGGLQRPNTFNPQQPPQRPGPYLQHPNSFPVQQGRPNTGPPQLPSKPLPSGPLTYVDTKTGRVSHNLYPPDHPMARGMSHDDSELSRDVYYGDKSYNRQLPGDVNTGMMWSETDENDMAYGKDYSKPKDRARREVSYERRRNRRKSSPPPPPPYH